MIKESNLNKLQNPCNGFIVELIKLDNNMFKTLQLFYLRNGTSIFMWFKIRVCNFPADQYIVMRMS